MALGDRDLRHAEIDLGLGRWPLPRSRLVELELCHLGDLVLAALIEVKGARLQCRREAHAAVREHVAQVLCLELRDELGRAVEGRRLRLLTTRLARAAARVT